jgi:hypothetical protein
MFVKERRKKNWNDLKDLGLRVLMMMMCVGVK